MGDRIIRPVALSIAPDASLELGRRPAQPAREGAAVLREALEAISLEAAQPAFDESRVQQKLHQDVREFLAHLVVLVNTPEDFRECLSTLTASLQGWSGCEAVGIRLKEGDDFPYCETRGFPAEFVQKESRLCARGPNHEILRDADGNPMLDCMCGNVLCGRFDPAQPFFTPQGSFWSNGTTALLAGTTDADRQARTRNRCNREGYESVALIPMLSNGHVFGLLQFNDHRPNRFSAAMMTQLEQMADTLAIVLARRHAEQALRQTEVMFRRLFTLSPVGAVIVGLDFHFQRCNEAFCQLLGYRENELVGKTFVDVTYPDDQAAGAAEIQAILRNELDVAQFQKRYLCRDGMLVWGEVNIRMVRDQGGAPVHFLSIVQDITARKQAEAEKAKLQAQLQQAQKMESVGRLAGGVAHDFNNKLGVILGHVEIALEQLDPALPVYADLEEIRKATQQSADLTRQLLAFARKQTIAPKVLDLNETVAGMLKMLRRLLGENIDLNWQPQPGLWPVRMDLSQIDQILANLCINSRDALAGVGKMTIETGNSVFDQDYCDSHAGAYPGEFVRLAVSDTGRGMDKETLTHIFEPFFTTKATGQGTGLGLATVYGAVKQNDGFINAYSEPNLGTTITIYLPRYVGKPSTVLANDAAKPALRGSETILLVEDEPAMLKMTAVILKRHGYTVLAADTPGEAIRLAREHSGTINLLITDVVMPEMNGRDLARNLLSLYPDIKRLFMSGYTADVIAHHGVLEQGVDFIQKPFSREVLAARVREMLDSELQTGN